MKHLTARNISQGERLESSSETEHRSVWLQTLKMKCGSTSIKCGSKQGFWGAIIQNKTHLALFNCKVIKTWSIYGKLKWGNLLCTHVKYVPEHCSSIKPTPDPFSEI